MVELRNTYGAGDKYDVIYGSWALSYLTDKECVEFLQDAAYGLRSNIRSKTERPGLIIIKETIR